jgi:hypothetical protein
MGAGAWGSVWRCFSLLSVWIGVVCTSSISEHSYACSYSVSKHSSEYSMVR